MVKIILIGIAVIGIPVGGLLVYAFFKSPEMHVSRELLINATPEAIFPHINNSRKANQWNWMCDEPGLEMSYSGPEAGLGSVGSWKSEGMMGVGTAEIVESVVSRSVKTKLSFIKPMEMSQLSEVSLNPSTGGTLVRLSFTWNNPFILRLMCIFSDMDKKMGDSFEKALSNLKRIVEVTSK